MPWKTPSELTDSDLRGAVTYMLLRQQELEVTLAQALMIVLSEAGEVPEPTEEEYRATIANLCEFLQEAYERMQKMTDAQAGVEAEVHSRN